MYLFKAADKKLSHQVQLLGSGTIFREVIKAAEILAKDFNVSADLWSVTSFNECRKDMESVLRHNRLQSDNKQCHVEKCLAKQQGPVIAATDYMKMYADQIRPAIKNAYHVLGTDGFGRSDNREALRDFFEVDAKMIAYTALKALHDEDKVSAEVLTKAAKKLKIDKNKPEPTKT
jgi:pyruvate dehydrogenase E1 component